VKPSSACRVANLKAIPIKDIYHYTRCSATVIPTGAQKFYFLTLMNYLIECSFNRQSLEKGDVLLCQGKGRAPGLAKAQQDHQQWRNAA
jgi:hypothetical protein